MGGNTELENGIAFIRFTRLALILRTPVEWSVNVGIKASSISS